MSKQPLSDDAKIVLDFIHQNPGSIGIKVGFKPTRLRLAVAELVRMGLIRGEVGQAYRSHLHRTTTATVWYLA